MGDKVFILKDDAGKRVIEGQAEIIEVIDYLGAGDYLIWCVFDKDQKKERVQRVYNIDEPVPGGGVK
jgi:hypothetical protein